VETAIDIIQKHLIANTKHEVCKMTAMLKGLWGRLMDMETEVKELRGAVEAGFAEMRAEFKTVLARVLAHDGCAHACVPVPLTTGFVCSLRGVWEPA
jgi:hypothetical protein